jgi:hypothetical protein
MDTEIIVMEIINALISKIEFLSRQNCELSRQVAAYREDYAARQNESESKAPSRRTRAAAKRG